MKNENITKNNKISAKYGRNTQPVNENLSNYFKLQGDNTFDGF